MRVMYFLFNYINSLIDFNVLKKLVVESASFGSIPFHFTKVIYLKEGNVKKKEKNNIEKLLFELHYFNILINHHLRNKVRIQFIYSLLPLITVQIKFLQLSSHRFSLME